MIVPVVLAGGIGERFWPMSRSSRPKQLLPLISQKSMMEETLDRTQFFGRSCTRPLVITGRAIAGSISAVLGARYPHDIIAEPVGKNTAPAIALAAAWIEHAHGPSTMLILPADHAISPPEAFAEAVYGAQETAQAGYLVVFGISPSRPDIGYGYIQPGDELQTTLKVTASRVERFIEKPDAPKAVELIDNGCLWNSGMFVWETRLIQQEFQRHMPELWSLVERAKTSGFAHAAIDEFYTTCESQSIDYGILEKSDRVALVRAQFSWDDVGSWESVARLHPVNESGTTVTGTVFEKDCSNSIIVNRSNGSVAAIGLDNVVVVTTDDAVLVISRDKVPDLKKYLSSMKSSSTLPSELF